MTLISVSPLEVLPDIISDSEKRSSPSSSQINGQQDRKMYKLHSLFYLGLHFDALGQSYESKQCMKMAIKTFVNKISGNSQDITYLLPVMHMTVRDWYDDDDDFDIDNSNEKNEFEAIKGGENPGDSELVKRLRESIQGMKSVELKIELKRRNLQVSGSKKKLQDRLIDAYLIDDEEQHK